MKTTAIDEKNKQIAKVKKQQEKEKVKEEQELKKKEDKEKEEKEKESKKLDEKRKEEEAKRYSATLFFHFVPHLFTHLSLSLSRARAQEDETRRQGWSHLGRRAC